MGTEKTKTILNTLGLQAHEVYYSSFNDAHVENPKDSVAFPSASMKEKRVSDKTIEDVFGADIRSLTTTSGLDRNQPYLRIPSHPQPLHHLI